MMPATLLAATCWPATPASLSLHSPTSPGNMSIAVQPQPAGALTIPGGPAQFSPNGKTLP